MSVYTETAELYTTISTAFDELERRRSDSEFVEKVRRYFAASPCPPELLAGPRAVISPALLSPNVDLFYFADIADNLPLKAICYEFAKDKFVHLNFVKKALGEMMFFSEDGFGQKKFTESVRVVDFEKDQGKPMNRITTVHGENFVDFHHRLVADFMPEANLEVHDFSDWFRRSYEFDTEFPYLRYLGLFILDGVLFGNFTTEKRESDFTNARVLPAFRRLREIFGAQPLIVPIEPTETDDGEFWCYYPEKIRQFI